MKRFALKNNTIPICAEAIRLRPARKSQHVEETFPRKRLALKKKTIPTFEEETETCENETRREEEESA